MTIAKQLADLEGYDIIGLTEVEAENAELFTRAAADGEGNKGSKNADFQYVISQSGKSDRMMIIWDSKRFELVGNAVEMDNLNDGNHRSPLVVKLRMRNTNIEFLFMVNHLARGNAALREQQATGLKEWADTLHLPVIAVGDYNFDYDIDDGEGNQAFYNMMQGNVWTWIKPPYLFKTQGSQSYYSMLDFIFTKNIPPNWSVDSRILSDRHTTTDDEQHSDHRPLEGRVFIN